MFVACEPLRAKVEVMEEFASVTRSIQAKLEICWCWAYVAWIAKPKFGHLSWPNPNGKKDCSFADLVNNIYILLCAAL